jgi:hypothetical protein
MCFQTAWLFLFPEQDRSYSSGKTLLCASCKLPGWGGKTALEYKRIWKDKTDFTSQMPVPDQWLKTVTVTIKKGFLRKQLQKHIYHTEYHAT